MMASIRTKRIDLFQLVKANRQSFHGFINPKPKRGNNGNQENRSQKCEEDSDKEGY